MTVRNHRPVLLAAGFAVLCALTTTIALHALPNPPAAKNPAADKPFADHHLVLQLSDDDTKKQSLVVSVTNNLLKFYGPDRITIEVVTFGPGIALVRADNPNRQYVDSLVAQGVQFDVCMNTVETIERQTGHRPPLNPNAKPVKAGVAQILALTEKGYILIRP
jgi:uncharacterized protein